MAWLNLKEGSSIFEGRAFGTLNRLCTLYTEHHVERVGPWMAKAMLASSVALPQLVIPMPSTDAQNPSRKATKAA